MILPRALISYGVKHEHHRRITNVQRNIESKSSIRSSKNRLCGRVKRQLPIFPWGYPHSIIRAEELNFRVRDGNGCILFAIVTGSPAHTGGPLERVKIISHSELSF